MKLAAALSLLILVGLALIHQGARRLRARAVWAGAFVIVLAIVAGNYLPRFL
jgi:hypothetical protein